ncbi:uncharacterized protein LOC119729142 [Patiria miniata]|uniref:Uncharacterized protein n=1 Tax=Patiria miniata TaxID=46514 RepID=A0A914A1T6_PATMI|nr:uncharacterized protein LOC119729142 [Patiria miniata]
MSTSFQRLHKAHLSRCCTALMVAILFLSTVKSDPGKTDCLVPDDVQLLAQLLSNGGIVMSPTGNEADEHEQSLVQDPRDIFQAGQVDLNSGVTPGDWHCPIGEEPPRHAPVHELAACPWRFVVDRDPTRYPPTVFHAVSRCGACLGPGGSLIAGTRCEPVTYQTKALRQKGCEQPGGVMTYDVENLEQTVAFQCTFIAK